MLHHGLMLRLNSIGFVWFGLLRFGSGRLFEIRVASGDRGKKVLREFATRHNFSFDIRERERKVKLNNIKIREKSK